MSGARIALLALAAALAGAPAGRAQQQPAVGEPHALQPAAPRAEALAPLLRAEAVAAAPAGGAPLLSRGGNAAAAARLAAGSGTPAAELLLRALGISALLIGGLWFAADWLRRRARARAGPGGAIEVVAMRGLGPRHRVALLEVGGARLLVGLSHDGMRTLHDFAEPAAFAPALARELPELDPSLAALGRFEGLDA